MPLPWPESRRGGTRHRRSPAVWPQPIQAQQDHEDLPTRHIARFVARGSPEPHPEIEIPVPSREPARRNSLGQFPEGLPIALVGQLLSCLELLAARGWFRRGDDQLFSICTDIERRVRVDVQKIQNRTIDHQRKTVPMLRKLFNHAPLRTYNVSPETNQRHGDRERRCRKIRARVAPLSLS